MHLLRPAATRIVVATPRGGEERSLLLRVTLMATLALASIEGYVQDIDASLSKAAPLLFLVVYAVHRVVGDRPVGISHPVVWCTLALTPVVLASTAVNLDNGYAPVYLLRWLPFLLLVLAFTDVLVNDIEPWAGLYAVVVGAAVASFGALVSFIYLGAARATGPMVDPNDLAYVLTAAVPIVMLAVRRSRHRGASVGWGLILALLVVGTAVTISRGGALALAAVLVWLVLRGLVPRRFLLTGAALLGLLALVLLLPAGDVVERAVSQKQYVAESNVESRLLRWQAAARMLGDQPLTGVGPGGFRSGYVPYSSFAEVTQLDPVAHNMYLEVGAELGLVGLVLFLGAVVAAFAASEQAVRLRRAAGAGTTDSLLLAAFAVQGSLVAICVTSVFLSQQYYMQLWAALATAAAVHVRSRRAAVG